MNFVKTLKHPSAFLPVTMSFAALITVLLHIVIYGIAREADEGAAAHIFQILIAGEVPIIAYFVIKWMPEIPKQALKVLALQIFAVLTALAPVFFFNL
jgi:hypothetical protein